ncbi:MAG: hypothetical protein R3C27_01215 [Hyphomonadaceae bacterium]
MVTRRSVIAGSAAPFVAGAAASPNADAAIDTVAQDLALLDAQPHLRSGGGGEGAVAAEVENTLRGAGFRVRRQMLSVPWFEPRRTLLAWPGGEAEVLPQAIVRTTGPNGLRAPLCLWRDSADAAAARGAIVLAILPRARHSRLMAPATRRTIEDLSNAGAAAIVLITDGPTGETIQLNAPFERDPNLPPIAVLGPAPGTDAIVAAHAGAEGRLVLDGEASERRSPNIWGAIERDSPTIVISTPRTGWTPAVGERGPGFAAFTALARWAPNALTRHSLIFVSTTAHEFDNAGGHAFLERHAPPSQRVALWAHLGAGFAARDFHEVGAYRLAPLPSPDSQRFLVASDHLLPTLRNTFAGQPGLENPYPTSMGAEGELSEIIARNYANVFGLLGAHRFHHVMQDRLDKVDPRWVQTAIESLKTSILAIAQRTM